MIPVFNFLEQINNIINPAKVVVVGGAVRDLLLGRSDWANDIDLMMEVPVNPIVNQCASSFGGKAVFFRTFGTAKIILPAGFTEISEVDFAQSRCEVYPTPGSLPVVSFCHLEEDLVRRDITINALAIELNEFVQCKTDISEVKSRLLDTTNGLNDIDSNLIRIIHDKSFVDDPTRLFRVIRYKTRFNFKYESETLDALNRSIKANSLATISEKRIVQELKKLVEEDRYRNGIDEMLHLGLSHPLYDKILPNLVDKLPADNPQKRQYQLLALLAKNYPSGIEAFFNEISLTKPIKQTIVTEYL